MTPIKSKCVVCGQDIGDSSLWIGGRIYHPECSPYHQSMQSADLKEARAELAEARAQIAEHIRLKNELVAKCYPAMDERDQLREQIAAKDAALSAVVAQYAKRTYGGAVVAADEQYPWIAQAIRALAAPARETK